VPILVFLGFSVLDLGPMYATDRDRQTDLRRQRDRPQIASLFNAPYPRGVGITVIADGMLHSAYIRHCELSWKFCTSFMLKMIVITTRHQNNDDNVMCMMSYSCISKTVQWWL